MGHASENPLKRLVSEINHRSLWRVLSVYVVASWIVFEVVQTLTEGLGLPDWFPAFAFVLLLLGFSAVLATAFVQEGGPGRDDEEEPAAGEVEGSPPALLFTWRNAILGAVGAFALWGMLAAGRQVFGGGQLPTGLAGGAEAADSAAPVEASIAVLPFENFSPDPDNACFADGLHDEILTELWKISGVKVISRTSVVGYRVTGKDVRTITGELGVNHVMEGTVRKADDRVRITTQLIAPRSDGHLWADTCNRELADIFASQGDVARRVARSLEATLSAEEESRLGARPTESLEAYDAYLRGWYVLSRPSPAEVLAVSSRGGAVRAGSGDRSGAASSAHGDGAVP